MVPWISHLYFNLVNHSRNSAPQKFNRECPSSLAPVKYVTADKTNVYLVNNSISLRYHNTNYIMLELQKKKKVSNNGRLERKGFARETFSISTRFSTFRLYSGR